MKNRIMQITAIISAISCMTACAAQTTSTVSEVTASTTVQTTPTPQETKAPLAETAQTTTTAQPETKAPQTAVTTTTSQTTSTPQETKAPETAAVTTTIQTTPAPEWTETKTSGTKYVNTDCYSRKKAVLGAETVKLYSVNEKVTVTAKTDTGYFKLSDGSFIHGDYLSDSKVVIQTTTTTAKEQETTPKPAATTSTAQQESKPTKNSVAWTEDDVRYVFSEVKKYADSVGFTNYDFPTEIEHFVDENSFGSWGGYDVTGRVWLEGYEDECLFYNSFSKKENIEYFINDYKSCIDAFMNPDSGIKPSPNCGFKFTWTTGRDMLKYYEACGWSTDGRYIGNCDIDTAYVFIHNH